MSIAPVDRPTDPPQDEQPDQALVVATRAGDERAYAVLWNRHAAAGRRAARSITSTIDADDLVSEAFTRIYVTIAKGGGPNSAFRPYLFAVIRNTAATWGGRQRDVPLEDADRLPSQRAEESIEQIEVNLLVSAAFEKLPERWRTLLWYLEVEGMKPREIAPLMGIKPNAVSALAMRAREGFRVAWLDAHTAEANRPIGHPVGLRLAG